MTWKGESRRHSLARRGIKTAKGYKFPSDWKNEKRTVQNALEDYLKLKENGFEDIWITTDAFENYPSYTAGFSKGNYTFKVIFNYYEDIGIQNLRFEFGEKERQHFNEVLGGDEY